MKKDDARLAARLAEEAGRLLLEIRADPSAGTGTELGRRGDQAANTFLLGQLAAERPSDAFLSEESVDDPARLDADRVWIIDPLDGTREFTMAGRADWAVHVALWENGQGITAAAVALPAAGQVFATDPPVVPASGWQRARPRILVSDTRPPAFIDEVAATVGAEVAPMGSAGAKTMAVLSGEADAYVHAGGQWEWDSAAPVGVALAAGLHASRIDGAPLEYNQPRPYVPDLIVSAPDLAGRLLDAIAVVAARRETS
jgi:3'(2'), 5'-bisphosphate nucleotidase